MAQETVIHRIDAELGTGQPIAPVPDDLALDGIDELLKVFVAYGVAEWGSYFADILNTSSGHTYTVRADGSAWRLQAGARAVCGRGRRRRRLGRGYRERRTHGGAPLGVEPGERRRAKRCGS
jgi:hypothetical protein